MGRKPILARLPEYFTTTEPAATRCMAILLEEPALREATLSWLTEETGVELNHVVNFGAERVNAAGTRPDIEGLDSEGLPFLMVEAKFGAGLTQKQVENYLRDQIGRLGELATEAVMLLVVPSPRKAAAEMTLEAARQVISEELGSPPQGHTASWNDVVTVWRQALKEAPNTADSLLADVLQFKALCNVLGGKVLDPFSGLQKTTEWRGRLEDYLSIVDAATKRLTPKGARLSGVTNQGAFLGMRYFPAEYDNGPGKGSAAAIGVHEDFADAGQGPIWMRFNRKTGGFNEILRRLRSSEFRNQLVEDDRALWLPLGVNASLADIDLINDIVRQAEAVRDLLRQP
ncbi:hypothetical protein [Microcella alkaliphila]|uniref:Restriction endonuclease, type I, EcoRI, R subun it/type III n=1 Tax=Microcella alkaliphila TaxID=279828 RepID=A0A0U5BUD1_9MICO|nr:hypothetical protein [Microcella alkaliphila]BAU32061.1 restriction endonuclease, type I, EcoRI, R subun it/type III [Microcella alkaliphila]